MNAADHLAFIPLCFSAHACPFLSQHSHPCLLLRTQTGVGNATVPSTRNETHDFVREGQSIPG